MSFHLHEGEPPKTDIATLTGRQDLAIQAVLNQRPHLTHRTPVRPQGEIECQGCDGDTVYLSRQDLETMHIE